MARRRRGAPRTAGRSVWATLPVALGTALALAAALLLAAALAPGGALPNARAGSLLSAPDLSPPRPIAITPVAPHGHRLSAAAVLELASRLGTMRRLLAGHPDAYPGVYLKGAGRWQVSYFTRARREIGQVLIEDHTGRVLASWTGIQVAWTMARAFPGAFGNHVSALYIWIPLCLAFLAPFVDWRRPRRLLHLDLLVLLAFSVSLAFFDHADIGASVPTVYPPLAYLLVRMLAVAWGRRRSVAHVSGSPGPIHLAVPVRWLVLATVALVAARVTLNLVDSTVIDVGYAGVIGGDRIIHGQRLYGGWPAENRHGDTYGPVAYEAYVPFVALFGWSGRWDDLPAAHAAAIVFDLLALLLVFLLGRRVRGPTLGIALAYAWAAYPFTLYALESNSDDSLVAVLVLASLLAATGRRGRSGARGVLAALATLTKFAPLALAPLLALHGLTHRTRGQRAGALACFLAAFVLAAGVTLIPALARSSPHELWARTVDYQAGRLSPFSLWGLYGGLGALPTIVRIGAVVIALVLAFAPRRADALGLIASAAAILIALEFGLEHWFYLYIPWFFALVMLVVLCPADGEQPASRPDRLAQEPSGAQRAAVLA